MSNKQDVMDEIADIFNRYKRDVNNYAIDISAIETPKNSDLHFWNLEVCITNKDTTKSKKYLAGHGTTWPSDFEDDLTNNNFD
ncbi:MAG: hypothetical protein CK423_06880 [Legionella sp.]|nr:MAG: hypothetical protein CK423_06880 [Legionella sp.]